jgi:hypothetical protein
MICLASGTYSSPNEHASAMPVRREYCLTDEIVHPRGIPSSCGGAPEVIGYE